MRRTTGFLTLLALTVFGAATFALTFAGVAVGLGDWMAATRSRAGFWINGVL